MTLLPMLSLALLGAFAGSLSGLLGIGGGVIIVPALIFLFGLTPHMAQGTTLALLVPPIGLLAAWTYYRQGHVHLPCAGLICLGFAAGGYFGAELAVELPNGILEKVFAVALLLIAVKVLAEQNHAPLDPADKSVVPHTHRITVTSGMLLVVLGLVVGAISGLIGIGGGVLMVPALVLFFGHSQHQAQGTTLALMVTPVGLLAAWQYYRLDDVDPTIAVIICVGFFFGAFLGARLATRLSSRWLTSVFGVCVILIALKMLFGA